MRYVKRWLEARIEEALEAHPVVVLTGPRQVGKSTLLENASFLKGWRYITLDDHDALDQAQEDPKGLLLRETPTIIDEVQRCPDLLLTVKYLVDKSRRKRKFILSGSGNISLRKAPRETLAGRAKYLSLTGFAFRELEGMLHEGVFSDVFNGKEPVLTVDSGKKADMVKAVWRGGLPGIVLASSERIALERLGGYIDTYIRRDIQDLVKIRHPERFRLLMESLAKAAGWESVQEELSKACGETRPNVSRYLSLLKDTDLLYDLRGYVTRNERSYKQSKYFWFDSGTACFLAGMRSPSDLSSPRVKGRYLENFIMQQILAWASVQVERPDIFYWKPKKGDGEVDFVVRSVTGVVGIEVKSGKEITFRDTRNMREFMKSHPETKKGIIVYDGSVVDPVSTNIYAVPWFSF